MKNSKHSKQVIVFLVLLLVGSLSVFSQSDSGSHPDFSGTWKQVGMNAKVPGLGILTAKKDNLLEITHTDPILKIIEKTKKNDKYVLTAEKSYYTDSRGEVNEAESDGKRISVKSKTQWDGKKLIVTLGDKTKIEWSLSSDGNSLTKKIFLTVNGNKMETVFAYEKSSGAE